MLTHGRERCWIVVLSFTWHTDHMLTFSMLQVQERCFYQHPAEAKASPKPEPQKPNHADLAARAAAWRALNASTAHQQQQTRLKTSHAVQKVDESTDLDPDSSRSCTANVDASSGNDLSRKEQQQPSDVKALDSNCSGQGAMSVAGRDAESSSAAQLDSQRLGDSMCDPDVGPGPNGKAALQQPLPSGPCAHLRDEMCGRLPGVAVTGQEGSDPVLAAANNPFLAAALPVPRRCNAACAIQNRGVGRRNKVRNRFRASVFRR